AVTTVPGDVLMLTVLKWTRIDAVTAACEDRPSTLGVTQWAAVSTQFGVTRVPVHRPPPTSSATTDGNWPSVAGDPPRIGAGSASAILTSTRWTARNHNTGRRMGRSIAHDPRETEERFLTASGRSPRRVAHAG